MPRTEAGTCAGKSEEGRGSLDREGGEESERPGPRESEQGSEILGRGRNREPRAGNAEEGTGSPRRCELGLAHTGIPFA